jgi:carbon storage regulator
MHSEGAAHAMLVLTRHCNESIMIGQDVEMKVVEIRGDKVKLGFTAPDAIKIYRKELLKEIAQENWSAARLQPQEMNFDDPIMRDAMKSFVQKHADLWSKHLGEVVA